MDYVRGIAAVLALGSLVIATARVEQPERAIYWAAGVVAMALLAGRS